jgi:uncharacterized Zn-binding protein involved in type VI secretion
VGAEVANPDVVHEREVSHIGQEHRCFDHLVNARTLGGKHACHVGQHLIKLGSRATFDHGRGAVRLGDEAKLAGDDHHVAKANGGNVWTNWSTHEQGLIS